MYQEPKYIPGEKVIVRSNEEEPTRVGFFKGWLHHPSGTGKLPIVTIDGEDRFCFSTVCAYDEELLRKLQSMGGKEAWYWLLEQKRSRDKR